jgi:hypothetical protein
MSLRQKSAAWLLKTAWLKMVAQRTAQPEMTLLKMALLKVMVRNLRKKTARICHQPSWPRLFKVIKIAIKSLKIAGETIIFLPYVLRLRLFT